MKSIIVPAEVQQLDAVQDFVAAALAVHKCRADVRFGIEVAVEELFVNIASYAYPDGAGDVCVSCEVAGEPECLTVIFADGGIPFDPLARDTADTSPDALMDRVGGLGILMAKKYSDGMAYRYEDGRNILTFTKLVG